MKKAVTVILSLVFVLLILAFAVAVPSGNLNEDAAERYREEQW